MTTDVETYTLRNGSTFEVKYTYPDANDPLTIEAIVEAMEYIGLFQPIPEATNEAPRSKPCI